MIKTIKTVEETWVGLQFVIVVFSDLTDLHIGAVLSGGSHFCRTNRFDVER